MKRTLLFLAFVAMWQSVFAYGFSAVAPSGQTLYYSTLSGGRVAVTCPGSGWSGYSEPTGDLTIPDSVTYGGTTYAVTSIERGAFSGCSGLTSVTIPNTVTSIGREEFKNCSGLTTVHFNADSCTFAGGYYSDRAFPGCHNITTFTFGNNVKIIPNYLCYDMDGLTSVTIPNSVTSIGEHAFDYCSGLTTVHFNADSCTSAGGSYSGAFPYCHNITTFTFGSNVKIIPNYLCYDMDGLTSVTIPNSVTSIGNSAFDYCSGLTSVTIPNSVTSIGTRAFYYCSGLTSVAIPNSVTYIGENAFYNCSGLTTVHFNADSCTSTGGSFNRAFYGCHNITTFTFGSNVKIIPDYLCYEMDSLTSVTIPNSVISIGHNNFRSCYTLLTVKTAYTTVAITATP